MKKIINILIATLFVLSCNNNSPVGVSLGEFRWTVDTLEYKESVQTLMESIFAVGKKDVLVGGHNARSFGFLFRFDGESWIPEIPKGNGGINLHYIIGFSFEDIWVAGDGGTWKHDHWTREEGILHYNGYKWNRIDIPEGRVIYDMEPLSPDNIWACGYLGMIYHYDGNTWNIMDTVITNSSNSYQLRSIVEYNDYIYSTGVNIYNNGLNSTVYLIKGQERSFEIIDSVEILQGESLKKWGNRLFKDKRGEVYSYGASDKIFRLKEDDQFEVVYDFPDEVFLIENLEDYVNGQLLVLENSGKLYKCKNGEYDLVKDFSTLFPERIRVRDVEYIDGEIFVVGYSLGGWPNVTYVFHGHE